MVAGSKSGLTAVVLCDQADRHARGAVELPACQLIFDAGDLFAHGCQLKQFGFNDRIIGLLRELRILDRLVPQIVRPIHAATLDPRLAFHPAASAAQIHRR